jgi:uncharacterized C2H2 Zn-finger protein
MVNGKDVNVKKENLNNTISQNDASNKKVNGEAVELHCPVCTQVFGKISEITRHIQGHCEQQTTVNGDTESRLREGLKSDTESRVREDLKSCPVCSSQFSKLTELRDHLQTEHTGELYNAREVIQCQVYFLSY